MDETRFHRQLDLVRPEALRIPVTVIGCGGIGSFAVLALAKMGCSVITVFDDDIVENHNLPNQYYKVADVGRPKVEALKDIVREFTEVEISAINEKLKGQTLSGGIVISAVDSMDVRQTIWQRVKYNPTISLYLDGRFGAEVLRLYSINPLDIDDIRLYEGSLYPSSETLPIRCTAKSVMYTVLAVSAFISGQVKKHCMGEPYLKEITCDLKLTHLMGV
jgi:molybdopterin/thiamine biosynthesis adenylyltransferase